MREGTRCLRPGTAAIEMAHIRQSRPESGREFQKKILSIFKLFPLRSAAWGRYGLTPTILSIKSKSTKSAGGWAP